MTVFTIAVMGVIVFALRFSFFALPQDIRLPKVVERSLYFVLPAVLMAMVVPTMILDNHGDFRPVGNPYLVGVAVGLAVGAVKRDSFFLIFASSVVAFALAKVVLA